MRLFHFLNEEFGLKDIRERRLKIARIDDLNDPFELIAVELPNRDRRKLMQEWRTAMASEYGVLCFSRAWHNPVQWSHYAQQHKGMCLGFEVADHLPHQVSYVSSRFNWPQSLDDNFTGKLLGTKFAHWSYEDEYRLFTSLISPEAGLYYYNFSLELDLRQVIVGARSSLSRADVAQALGGLAETVEVFKARPAFRSFRVVRNRNDSLWT
jgi:hypothetical protein